MTFKGKGIEKGRGGERERKRERERERERYPYMYVYFLLWRAWVWHKADSIVSAEESASDGEKWITNFGREIQYLLSLGGISYGNLTCVVRQRGRRERRE